MARGRCTGRSTIAFVDKLIDLGDPAFGAEGSQKTLAYSARVMFSFFSLAFLRCASHQRAASSMRVHSVETAVR
jgi:hypothetical protein